MSERPAASFWEALDPNFLHLIGLLTLDFVLRSDVIRAREALADPPPDYHRRQYVRVAFAQLEGSTFAMKQLAIAVDQATLTPPELALLKGEGYRLTDKGELKTVPALLSLPSDMRFAFRTYAKTVGLEFELPVEEQGWKSLQLAKRVRDRLMHPRSAKDLDVTDEELRWATQAAEWFETQSRRVTDLMADQIARNQGLSEADVDAFRNERRRIDKGIARNDKSRDAAV